MRILQVSNIVSHHQLPLARVFAASLGEAGFRFAATDPPDPARRALGWSPDEPESWILRAGERSGDRREFEEFWDSADVVVSGVRLPDRYQDRLRRGRLTFYMSERWWKPPLGGLRLLSPSYARMAGTFRGLARSPLFHFLAIGENSARDMGRIADFAGRAWRWGYFPLLTRDPGPRRTESGAFRVLWAGRMLAWKRVDTIIRAFRLLQRDRRDARLTLLGDGPERRRLGVLAERLLPAGTWRFLPPCPSGDVLRRMREHHVYVLASSAAEGWGVVVNEAMGERCVVAASAEAGAAGSMIRHEVNGLLFPAGDWRRLGDLLCSLAADADLRERLAEQGRRDLESTWSPQAAAGRFLRLCEGLLSGGRIPAWTTGPLSPAEGGT